MRKAGTLARLLLAASLTVGLMPSTAFASEVVPSTDGVAFEGAAVEGTASEGAAVDGVARAGATTAQSDSGASGITTDAPATSDLAGAEEAPDQAWMAPGPEYDEDRVAALQAAEAATGSSVSERASAGESASTAVTPGAFGASSDVASVETLSDEEKRAGDWGYIETEEGAMISGYYGSATTVTIPASVDGMTVDSVRFLSPSTMNLRSVTFPASLRTIGGFSFEGMASLEEVVFPAGSRVEVVGDEAFAYTGLTSFTMPASLKSVGENAFMACYDLEFVQFNDALEPMSRDENIMSGSDIFKYVSYHSIASFSDRVEFRVPSTSANFKTVDGALLSKDGSVFYERPCGSAGSSYAVPSGVREIAKQAFYAQKGLASITLPSSLRTVHDYAFGRSGITSLTIPDSVTKVYGSICYECESLRSVAIGDGVTELGSCAGWNDFFGCSSLSQVTLGENLQVIGNACFAETALESVDIPASVRQINYGAFGDTPTLKKVTGAEGLETVYRLAFRGTGLSGFPFGERLNFVSGTAFQGCASFDGKYPTYLTRNADGDWTRNGMTADGDGSLLLEGTEGYARAYEVLDLVNKERAAVGKKPLTMDEDLMTAAMQRAAETVVYFSHTRPDGQSCFTVSDKASGENIAAGSSTAAGVMTLWMNSSGHKANILDEDWSSIGIGCFQASNGTTYWAQLFGTASSTTPARPADKAASHYVSVKLAEIDPALRIGLSTGGSNLEAGSSATVRVTGTGISDSASSSWAVDYTAENEGFQWASSDSSVLSVDASGTVRAVSAGVATVTASSGKIRISTVVTVGKKSFSDVVPGAWYEPAVDYVSAKGLVEGYGDTRFGVDDPMTRKDFVTVLWRYAEPEAAAAYDGKAENEVGMNGIESNKYWTAAANWAVKNGVVNGVDDGAGNVSFEPDGRISREQLARIVANFNDFDANTYPTASLDAFPDVNEVAAWAAPGLAWAVDNGVISGKAENDRIYLRGSLFATRAEVAKILMNAIEGGVL